MSDFFPAGFNDIFNIFCAVVVILVIMFVLGKISFKQLIIISGIMIITIVAYLNHAAKDQPDLTKTKASQELNKLNNLP